MTEAEIIFCIRYEMAETIEDLLARRTGAQFHGWEEALEAAPRVAELLAQEKHWEPNQRATALSQYSTKIHAFLDELGLNEAKK